jgi:hypothetical protein
MGLRQRHGGAPKVSRHFFLTLALACGTLAFAAPSGAQTANRPSGSSPASPSDTENFEPLAQWTKAVLAGDRTALSEFYIVSPQAYAQTPDSRIPNPAAEESGFWSAFKANGLVEIEPKILEETVPQPNALEFVLRVEMSFESKDGMHKSVVGTGQVWVHQANVWKIAIVQRGDAKPMAALRLPEPKTPNTHLYPEPADAPKELSAALADSKADHKRVLVIFGANWCYD